MGQAVDFTPARFSVDALTSGPSTTSLPSTSSSAAAAAYRSRSIITSTGQYVIIWNMAKVLSGHPFEYQIRKYADTVVADSFKFGQADRSILVTLPHQVTLTSKKALSKPSPRVFKQ